jgi:predicted nuclease of predicted toxin-antitoxin system
VSEPSTRREAPWKVKLDENLGARGARLLSDGGWDVATVFAQGLNSATDATLIEVCRIEGRALITLDEDSSSILRFPPARYARIVVLRLPEPLTPASIEEALRRLIVASAGQDLSGRLWVIDAQRIREFDPPAP